MHCLYSKLPIGIWEVQGVNFSQFKIAVITGLKYS